MTVIVWSAIIVMTLCVSSDAHMSPTRRLNHIASHFTVAEVPLFRFGAIADIQFADILSVGVSFWGRPRYYRDALGKAAKASSAWIDQGCNFAVNLGDSVDRVSRGTCQVRVNFLVNKNSCFQTTDEILVVYTALYLVMVSFRCIIASAITNYPAYRGTIYWNCWEFLQEQTAQIALSRGVVVTVPSALRLGGGWSFSIPTISQSKRGRQSLHIQSMWRLR